jgi:hypothetical protein
MGGQPPLPGEFVRVCIEIYGTKLPEDPEKRRAVYNAWKKDLGDVADKYEATYKTGELIKIPKARRKKRR